jgi:murein DD-endopeptidase MepM/ murein hydrolase activator NlpD
MKKAPRSPSRWTSAGWRTLFLAVTLSSALGACSVVDNTLYGNRQGTVEYPGSGAPAGATAVYIVREKDTVDGVASRFGVSSQSIIERNKLKAPYQLKAGQPLDISGARPGAGQSTNTTATAAAVSPTGPVKSQSLEPPSGSAKSEAPRSAAPAGEPTPLSPPATAARSGSAPRFEWPVQGKVLAGYGPKADGQRNDGIDIQAEKGTAVKAADSGTVIYAGSEVRGMGNLLLIKHANGYITAYAHNESLLVKKNDTVKKGQTIARVGNSGGTPDPQLHFEVRRGNKTIDPATVLPPS